VSHILSRLVNAIVSGVSDALSSVLNSVASGIFDIMLQWIYMSIFNAVANFFTQMAYMGAEIFDLPWVAAVVHLFSLFGWTLFIVGTIVAVFDLAIESQSGRANIKNTALNVLKGFAAVSLFTILPIELYKFAVTLQNVFARDLVRIFAGVQTLSISGEAITVLEGTFRLQTELGSVFNLLAMIAFAYCVIKIFFQNIIRGGILLMQIAVGSLYMFSLPRGYSDGFYNWCRQVIALCLTAFMQTTLLFLGLMTFTNSMLLGLGIMLSAAEVPRIAAQFGLDTSLKFNMMSTIHATNTAIAMTRSLARMGGR